MPQQYPATLMDREIHIQQRSAPKTTAEKIPSDAVSKLSRRGQECGGAGPLPQKSQ
jgi:hypothetical protein